MNLRTIIGLCFVVPSLCLFLSAQQNKKPVTNNDVVKMVHAGLPESTIVLSLESNDTDLDTSPQALIELKDQGVSPKVMDAMLAAASRKKSAASAPLATSPSTEGAASGTVTSPEGRALIAKVVENLGGKEALAKVRGTRVVSARQGKIQGTSISMETEITMLFPDRLYMTSKAQQFSSTTAYVQGRAWMNLNGKNQNLPPGAQEEVDKAIKLSQIYVAQHADDPAYAFVAKGSEKVGDVDTAILEITTGSFQSRWYVDPKTGELKRVSRMAGGTGAAPMVATFEYADWRVINGVKVPFKVMQSGGLNLTDEVKTFEINPAFDESKFANSGGTQPATTVNTPPAPATAAPSGNDLEGKTFPAGGNWTFELSSDKLTGAAYGILELKADEQVTDGIATDYPRFIIMCGGTAASPRWINSKLISPVVLGMGDTHSPLSGSSQQFVILRADDKMHTHAWNIADDFHVLFVDKGATKEFTGSTKARIQFRDAGGHNQVAIFSPAGLDKTRAATVCGDIMK